MPDGHQHYDDQQQYSGDQATNVKRASNHMPQEDRVQKSQSELQTQYAKEQAAQLHDHVEIDNRAVVDPPVWDAMSQQGLHDAATLRNDPGTVDALGRAFTLHGNELAAAANDLFGALTTLDAAWEGDAAATARGSIQPLATHSGQMGQSAQLMGTSLSQQSVAASNVQRLPPPQEFDASAALKHNKDVDANGGTPIDINAETGKANANKAEQVRFLTEYTNAMAAADKQMPVFVKPPETIKAGGGGDSTDGGGGAHVKAPKGTLHAPVQGTAPVPTGASAPGSGAYDPNDPNNNGNDIPTIGTPVSSTSTSGFTGNPTPVSTSPAIGGGPVSGAPHGPSAGSGGFGGSFGNFNGGTAGGPNSAGGANGAGGSGAGAAEGSRGGAGGRGGMPGGGMPAEEAFGRGGRGAGGAGGMGGAGGRGGMGGMGGHGANGEEDEEHERPSYLVEPDPDAVFDTDQMTVPPVIGGE